VGASVAVQKELLRYASITTTMNLYGTVLSERKREANGNVVQMNVPLPSGTWKRVVNAK
jgi:hypothetical protein